MLSGFAGTVTGAAPEPPGRAALPGGHWEAQEARSLLRNAGWPQASGVFSKEVLTFVSLRVQQTCGCFFGGGGGGGE